ncbi:peptidylprolyl isomerase [Sphingomonas sp.]|uniref:peptidylprolyl isomerase n=1 Tax=Sphingomonas sp. TaxID=28214 RepID=UPI00325FABB0
MFLPFAALALTAAKQAPVPVAAPVSMIAPAAVAADPANRLTLELSTGGRVVLQLRPDVAPLAVQRIQLLAQQHFYDGLKFHRVIPGFMAQGGDPKGDGSGGSPLPDLKAEFNDLPHLRGSMSMARATGPDSANSQFYIMFGPKGSLDHHYTVIGRVIEGMAAVDAIAPGEPPEAPTTIVHATIGAPVAMAEAPATIAVVTPAAEVPPSK